MPTQRPPRLEAMFDALFAAHSVSSMIPAFDSSNRAVITLLAEWAADLGFEVDVQAIDGAPGKYNMVATLGRGAGGLVLAGHTDTVPWDEHGWHHDPLRATVNGDRVYGLGAADMKSFFALVLDALRGTRARDLAAPIVILATADEESTMSGARALTAASLHGARHALIGEPTGMRPVRAHKGIMMEALRVTGRSGHSSDPAFGDNAIEGMHHVLSALMMWRAELQREYADPVFRVPYPTMNFGHVHGGDNPNRICPTCDLQLDLRPLPGMDITTLRAELLRRATDAVAGTAFRVEGTALFGGVPALATAPDAALVRATEALTGHAAEAVAFATEAPYLADLGVETVILGPGDIAQAHQPDEYLLLNRVAPMQRVVRDLVQRFCIAPEAA